MAGCASAVDPRPAIEAATTAVSEANRNEAARYAPTELGIAQEKLNLAQQEAAKKHFLLAQRLGEKAAVDARLAQVVAQAHRAQLTAAENEETAHSLQGPSSRRN